MSASPHITRAGNVAIDNHPVHTENKVRLRRWVLDEVRPASVFDVFAGLDGEMHRRVWRDADRYVGCDERWQREDGRSRFVGDSSTVLRSVDLAPYNVFDVDCYGQPWPIMLVLAARRRWLPGEVGAVVCTDSALRTKFGYASHAMVAAAGLTDRKLGKTSREEHRSMTWLALARWARTCGVEVTGFRRVDGHMGNGDMQYFAAVFRGQSPSDACATGR